MRYHAYYHTEGGIDVTEKRFLRSQLWEDQHGRCAYCLIRMRKPDTTIDHYLPLTMGGTDEYQNLRGCCRPCNSEKGGMHPAEWERVRTKPVPINRETRAEILTRIARAMNPRKWYA